MRRVIHGVLFVLYSASWVVYVMLGLAIGF